MKKLLEELKAAMSDLGTIYIRRDALVRETNELMIKEHNTLALIQRINVDLISAGD